MRVESTLKVSLSKELLSLFWRDFSPSKKNLSVSRETWNEISLNVDSKEKKSERKKKDFLDEKSLIVAQVTL